VGAGGGGGGGGYADDTTLRRALRMSHRMSVNLQARQLGDLEPSRAISTDLPNPYPYPNPSPSANPIPNPNEARDLELEVASRRGSGAGAGALPTLQESGAPTLSGMLGRLQPEP